MVSLTDRQLAAIMDAARPLPVDKRDVYLRRIAAMLVLRGGYGHYDDADVSDAAKLALTGLARRPRSFLGASLKTATVAASSGNGFAERQST